MSNLRDFEPTHEFSYRVLVSLWICEACCQALAWPREFMTVTVNDESFNFPRLRRQQEHLHRRLLDIVETSQREIVVTYYLRMPSNFRDPIANGYCLCAFGGCCKLCIYPSSEVCGGCGNNGCCRTDNCGDECCEGEEITEPERRCPFLGCKPEWAVDWHCRN